MKLFKLLLIVLSAASAVAAQRPQAMPTPEEAGVVKISTTLIQLDVTVVDGKGKVVRGLKPEDFEILENGERQKISNFSFISAEKQIGPDIAAQPDAMGVPAPPAAVKMDSVRRTVALVVDDLALSFESVYQTRRALKKFVDEQMQDGDLVAIIRTGAGIGALQQFTADKRLLHAAIERVRWNPIGRGGIGAFAPIEPTMLEEARAAGDLTVSDEDLEQERNFNNSFDDFRGSTFATGTLGALRYIVEGMGELPGRKSVVLFSDGFRLLERDSQGFSGAGGVLEFLRKLVDVANRSSVVFYTIDPRGLVFTGFTAADRIVDTSPQAIQRTLSTRSDELIETQAGLRYLAEETGGFAVTNNNDIIGGLRKVIEDQSYYLIGYEPDSDTFDPIKRRYNRLEVRVARKDLTVRYRSGFFNVANENIARAPTAELTPVQQIQTALTSPFAVNDIRLSLNSLYGNDARSGNFVRSLLHVDAGGLKFVDMPDGRRKAEIAILAVSFGDNGVPVDQISRAYTINVDDRGYRKIMAEGFVYHFAFPVKKPGAYQYRVAIRDQTAGKVGSANQFIEVPSMKKGNLTLSGIVLERHSFENWKALAEGRPASASEGSTALTDTSLRRFRSNGVLQYAFEIYNARLDAAKRPSLTTKIRLFRGRTVVLDGVDVPYDPAGQTDPERLKAAGAISLGREMPPGDYVLQVIVIDNLAKSKRKLKTSYVQFEVYE